MDRRAFVRSLPVLSTGLWVGAASLPLAACGGMAYLAPLPGGREDELVVAASSVPAAGALVQRPAMERPVYLRRAEDGAYTALLLRCTHRGCQPDPVGERLVCPCHGSEFDLGGAVLEGPARRDLTRYPVRVEASRVIVTLRGAGR